MSHYYILQYSYSFCFTKLINSHSLKGDCCPRINCMLSRGSSCILFYILGFRETPDSKAYSLRFCCMSENHQYALDTEGKWINAQKTIYNRKARYFCPIPQHCTIKLVKPSGALGKRKFCDYFAHITKNQKLSDCTKKTNFTSHSECTNCGESSDHRNAKHRLREMQGLFTFIIQSCPRCKAITLEEDCSSGQISLEVRSVDKRWRYDCLLYRENGSKIALEIVHSHYTTEEKILSTRLSGIEIAEFRASDVLTLVPGSRIENLIERRVKCLECLVKGGMEWFRDLYVEEFWIMWNFENMIEEGYFIFEKKLLKKIELKRISDEADLKWMLRVWEEENDNIKELERDISRDYSTHWNMLEFRKRITGLPSLEKAKLIIQEYVGEFYIIHPNFHNIKLGDIWKEDENGSSRISDSSIEKLPR